MSLSYPYGPLTSCKKSKKSLEPFLRKLASNYERTDGLGRFLRTSSDNFLGPILIFHTQLRVITKINTRRTSPIPFSDALDLT